jgi:hypothetical protein
MEQRFHEYKEQSMKDFVRFWTKSNKDYSYLTSSYAPLVDAICIIIKVAETDMYFFIHKFVSLKFGLSWSDLL